MDENEDLMTTDEMLLVYLLGQDVHIDQTNVHLAWRNAHDNIRRACGEDFDFNEMFTSDEADGVYWKTMASAARPEDLSSIFDRWS